MKSLEQLHIFFTSDLHPELQVLERVRKEQVYRQLYIVVAMFISITLAIILILPALLLVFMSAFLIVYFLIFGFKRKRFDYKKSYKETILKKTIAFLFDEAEYSSFRFIPKRLFEESKLFINDPAIYNGEDLVQGKMYSTTFQYSELHTQDRIVDSDGKTSFPTIFKGLYFIAELQEELYGETFVLSDFSERFSQQFASLYKDINIPTPEKIPVENSAFQKSFALLSTDGDEAKKILSEKLINLLLQYRKQSGVNVQLAFRKKHMHIALPERSNLFEASMYKSLLKFDDVEQYYTDLEFCRHVLLLTQENTHISSGVN